MNKLYLFLALTATFCATTYAGTLGTATVVPNNDVAGGSGTAVVTFTTVGDVPADGKILITFPSGYDLTGTPAASSTGSNAIDGNLVVGVDSQVLTITRDSGSVISAEQYQVSLTNIKNPGVSGGTGAFTIQTTNNGGDEIDINDAVPERTITPAALTGATVVPNNDVAGATGTAVVTFTTINPVPNNGKIVIIFPSGYDLTGTPAASSTGSNAIDGTLTAAVGSANTLTITRAGGGTAMTAKEYQVSLTNIKNPTVSGGTGAFTITTTTATPANIDTVSVTERDIDPADATFSANPADSSGTITANTAVTISSTGAAHICYTVDSATPECTATDCATNKGTKYTSEYSVTATTTIKALGCGGGTNGNSNAVALKTYTWTAANPTFAPAAGAINETKALALTSAGSDAICYTTDGSAPSCFTNNGTCNAGMTYDASSKPSLTQAVIVKAIGCTGAGKSDSAVAQAAYTATAGAVSFSPAAGTITASASVTLSSAVATSVCYTTDGSTPSCYGTNGTCNAGTAYSSAISVAATTTIKAIGCAGASGTDSAVGTAAYTWTAANPTFTPAAGHVAKDTALTLASAGSATVCYRTDGTPACKADGTCEVNSTAYNASSKPTVTTNSTWKAIGCAGTGKSDSSVVTAVYSVPTPTTTTAAPASTTISGASTGAVWSAMVTVLALMGVSSML